MPIPNTLSGAQIVDKIELLVRERVKVEVAEFVKEHLYSVNGTMSYEGDWDVEYETEVEFIDLDVEVSVTSAVKRKDIL